MKRVWIALLAVLLMLSLVFTACGAMSKSSYNEAPAASSSAAAYGYDGGMMMYDTAVPQEAEAFNNAKSEESGSGAQVPLADRKIVKHSDMRLETMEFDQALEDILTVIKDAGGYIQNQQSGGRSLYTKGDYYERSAQINARVPADKLDEVANTVGGLCNVVSKSESMDDITDSYFDTAARLESLKIQEERLLEILKKAEKLEDIIQLERALSDVRYEIESYTSSLKRMDSQVSYSYLNITVQEVVEYNIVKNQPKTFWEKVKDSGSRSLQNLSNLFQGIVFFAIEDLPVLLIVGAIIFILVWVVVRIVKKVTHRNNRQPVPPAAPSVQKPILPEKDNNES